MTEVLEAAIPVADWPVEIDERVLLYVVHDHAQWEPDPVVRREKWEEWCRGYWTDFNGGGWVWDGICGHVTHVAPLVTEDDGSGDIIYPPRPTTPVSE